MQSACEIRSALLSQPHSKPDCCSTIACIRTRSEGEGWRRHARRYLVAAGRRTEQPLLEHRHGRAGLACQAQEARGKVSCGLPPGQGKLWFATRNG